VGLRGLAQQRGERPTERLRLGGDVPATNG
jgi:hypothetical protein